MKNTETQWWRRERGSALLLTLFLTLAGAAILGLTVDATSLVWVRSNAQTTANLVASAVALEQGRNTAASPEYLLESARAVAALNGYSHGAGSVAVHLEQLDGKTSVLLEKDADVFFLRMIRPEPVAIRARAIVAGSAAGAGL